MEERGEDGGKREVGIEKKMEIEWKVQNYAKMKTTRKFYKSIIYVMQNFKEQHI